MGEGGGADPGERVQGLQLDPDVRPGVEGVGEELGCLGGMSQPGQGFSDGDLHVDGVVGGQRLHEIRHGWGGGRAEDRQALGGPVPDDVVAVGQSAAEQG